MSTYHIGGELYHYGIKGQKRGVRRFQNEDRTWTEAGKERYGKSSGDQAKSEKNEAREQKRAERASRKEARKRMIKDAANVHSMSDAELLEKIGRLQKEKQLMELTYDRLTSSGDPKKNMMIQAGKKVAGAALAGFGAYAGYALLSGGKLDPKTLASYMFSNPNKKK